MRNDGTQPTRYDMIANQMMKGCSGSNKSGNLAGTDEQVNDFKRVYGETIAYVESLFPKSSTISVGICGAIGKAILWYGKEKMRPFIEGMVNRQFNGRTDPLYVFWEWILRSQERNPNKSYRKTVAFIRIFIRGGECKGYVKPAQDDIFEWNDTYRVMCPNATKNQYGEYHGGLCKQSDEAIAADIDDALSGSPT